MSQKNYSPNDPVRNFLAIVIAFNGLYHDSPVMIIIGIAALIYGSYYAFKERAEQQKNRQARP